MLVLAKLIQKILKILGSEKISPQQIGRGIAMGFLIALVPFNWVLGLALFAILFLVNINAASGLLVLGILKPIIAVVDPILDTVGGWVLIDVAGLKWLFQLIYQIPLMPYTNFNNTVTLGGLIVGIVVFVPTAILGTKLVVIYREKLHGKIAKSKFVKFLRFEKVGRFLSWVNRFK